MGKKILEIVNLKVFGFGVLSNTGMWGFAIIVAICIYYIIMRDKPVEREYFSNGRIKKETFRKLL